MMENTPLFSVLTGEQRMVVAERMTLETRRAGDLIYQIGRPATALFLIKSGWARLLTEQFAVLANLGPGSLLGDADMVSGRPYSTSSEAASDLSLWVLAASDLKAIQTEHPQINRALKAALGLDEDQALERHLRRVQLLAGLGSEQLRQVASHLQPAHFAAGQMLFEEGTEGKALLIIDEGRAQVVGPVGVLDVIGAGETCGEGAFLTGEPHTTDVTAVTDVSAWSLARADFEALALSNPVLALNFSRLVSRKLRERTLRATATVQVIQTPAPVAPARPAAVTGTLTGLHRATDSATSWWGRSTTWAKIRLAVILLLLIWLIGVAAPAALLSLNQRVGANTISNHVAASNFNERALLVAMAADLPLDVTPTFTPWPTETPIPTATFTPTATPTETPLPTATFTPVPTDTPTPVPTRVVVRQAAPAAAAKQNLAAAAAAAAPAPTVKYKLIEMRRLSACENRGKHNVFVKVIDAAGNPVDGVTVIQSPADQPGNVLDKSVSGDKGPGLAEFALWKMANYGVYVSEDGVNPTSSDIARPVHSNFTDEEACPDGGGGNTLFHNSFNVIFQKTF